MTIEEAIADARATHAAAGCVCPGDVVAVIRNDHFPGATPSREHYNVTIEHLDWCPLYQTMRMEGKP